MRAPLSAEQVEQALRELSGWSWENDRLDKTFSFSSFPEAISFIVRVAFSAERLDHHPELHNVYNRVDVSLSTHDAGNRVTQKDLDLAHAIQHFAWTA